MMETEAKLAKKNQSVEKTIRLVEILAESDEPMKLQDVSALAGMPSSTALRMLNTLLELGYINQDRDTLRYSLSLKFAYIGERAQTQMNITRLVHPHLTKLAQATGECTCFAVEQGSEVVYLDVVSNSSDNILTVTQRIGKRAPLYCTGIGKLFLTNYTSAELKNYMETTDIVQYTPNTVTTLPKLQQTLDEVRARGFALDNGECDLGACCVAAPILDYTGLVTGGISVTAPTLRLTAERITEVAPMVLHAAENISRSLAFRKTD